MLRRGALSIALSVLQRLLAPFLVYVTEEVWSWWQEGSVHRSAWPVTSEVPPSGDPLVFVVGAEVLGAIRKAKSEASVSMRTSVSRVVVTDTERRLGALEAARRDVMNAGVVGELVEEIGDAFAVHVTLADEAS